MLFYQPTFSTLDIKKQMMNIMFLHGNQKEYVIQTIKRSYTNMETKQDCN